jgi:hypothetical protein
VDCIHLAQDRDQCNEQVDCIYLAQDRDQCNEQQSSTKDGEFLTRKAKIIFSKRTLLHKVS